MPTEAPARPEAAELRSKLLEAGDQLRELREKKTEERGETWKDDVRDAITTIHTLDSELTAIERAAEPPESHGPRAAFRGGGDGGQAVEFRSIGQQLAEDEGYEQFAQSKRSGSGFYEFEARGSLRSDEFRTLLTTGTTEPAAGVWIPRGQPIPPRPRQRRLFARDLLSVQETGLNSIPYIREVAALDQEGGASAVTESSAKPEVEMEFEQADAPVRKIAAWIPATTEIIDDAPTLRGYIDTRLGYMLDVREEDQILNGSGTAPNLRGIRQTTGLQTQAAVASDYPATLGRAISKVELVDGDADGIVMHPTDFWVMLTTRYGNQFDGGFGGGLPFSGAVPGVWGVPVVRTRAMTAGKALVGAWALGATVFDRQGTTIRVGNQHAEYFTQNRVAILAEKRVALAVHRPDFFVEATL